MQEEVILKTSQVCKSIFVWVVILMLSAFIWWGTYRQLFLDISFGSQVPPDWVLVIIWIIFGLIAPATLIMIRLSVEVLTSEIRFRFSPFQTSFQSFKLDQIESLEVTDIRPIVDFGGLGVRFGSKGKGYIMGGRKALQLKLKNQIKPIFITTNNPSLIVEAVKKLPK